MRAVWIEFGQMIESQQTSGNIVASVFWNARGFSLSTTLKRIYRS